MTAAVFANQIQKAFAADSPPEGRLTPCSCAECNELNTDLLGRAWTELTLSDLVPHAISLPLFTPEAFRYYLPAFLLTSFRDEPEAWDLRFYTIIHLGASARDPRTEVHVEEQTSLFNRLQVRLVVAYLEYWSLAESGGVSEEATFAHEHVWQPRLNAIASRGSDRLT